jgi:hypothetical protein
LSSLGGHRRRPCGKSPVDDQQQENILYRARQEISENETLAKLLIHSHLPLTLYLAGHRVRALFRLFRYSSSFDRPRT